MKYISPLIVVTDMKKSRKFYEDLFELAVTCDYGANITFADGFSLQTKASWESFIEKSGDEIKLRGNDAELYFETDCFDAFIKRLNTFEGIEYVHPVKEHDWGQRAVRIYDPDYHILEVAESLENVCRRLLEQGMTVKETAIKTMQTVEFVEASRQ